MLPEKSAIEAHEAINAYGRDIMLTAKEHFEANGWRVIHGIVDSIWVEAEDGAEQTDLDSVAQSISDEVGIRLEYEAEYDWICFVPRRESETGALTKYFGKKTGEDVYKVGGVEIRQRSTMPFISQAQRALMDALDEHRTAKGVLETCQRFIAELEPGSVDPGELVIKKRVSKPLEAYSQSTQNYYIIFER